MLAGAVTLEQLTPEVYRDLAELTERLRQGIREVCAELEVPVQVTGLGSLFGIHFTRDQVHNYRDVAGEDTKLRSQVFLGYDERGYLDHSKPGGCSLDSNYRCRRQHLPRCFQTSVGTPVLIKKYPVLLTSYRSSWTRRKVASVDGGSTSSP